MEHNLTQQEHQTRASSDHHDVRQKQTPATEHVIIQSKNRQLKKVPECPTEIPNVFCRLMQGTASFPNLALFYYLSQDRIYEDIKSQNYAFPS